MIFDQLCGMAERFLPQIESTLRRAKIFLWEGGLPAPEEIATHSESLQEGFYLPYPVTAIETIAPGQEACRILCDVDPGQTGTGGNRFFVDAMPLATAMQYPTSNFSADVDGLSVDELQNEAHFTKLVIAESRSSNAHRILCINMGFVSITRNNETGRFVGQFDLSPHILATKDETLWQYEGKGSHNAINRRTSGRICSEATDAIMRSYASIMLLNSPENFILEMREKEVKPARKKKKADKIPRFHQRPTYTLLKPAEIRKKMHLPELAETIGHGAGHGASMRPHERRRHDRFLSDPRYAHDDAGRPLEPKIIPHGPRMGEPYFKKVVVPATWIGPVDNVVGNKIYRVVLER